MPILVRVEPDTGACIRSLTLELRLLDNSKLAILLSGVVLQTPFQHLRVSNNITWSSILLVTRNNR